MLVALAAQYESVDEWQEEALFRLPQASRSRRQEIVLMARRKLLETNGDEFVRTPLQSLLAWPSLGDRLKRDLVFAQYLRTTPLVWEAIQQVVLPRAEAAASPLASEDAAEITLEEWMAFLDGRLNTNTESTMVKTRQHITAHLLKFGLLRDEPVLGDAIARRFFATFYDPAPEAFWFSLAQEFFERGWSSRSLDYVVNESWTRIAYCTRPTYARYAVEEAERKALVRIEYYGSDKQVTLRGSDPVGQVAEAIQYG